MSSYGKAALSTEERALASIASFRMRVFIRELLINCFPMFSVPILYMLHGHKALANRQFGGGVNASGAFTVVQVLLLAAFVLTNVLFFVFPSPHISAYELIFIEICWVLRNAVVATKWAYMSPTELRDVHVKYISPKWMTNNQIITGWIMPPREVVEEQLLMACVRQQVDLHRLSFRVQGVMRKNDKAAADALSEMVPEEPVQLWNAHEIAMKTLISARDRVARLNNPVRLLGFSLALLHAFIPIIARGVRGEPLCGGGTDSDHDWAACVFTAEAAFLNWFLVFSNIAFIAIGALDFLRRLLVMESLNDLLVRSTVVDVGVRKKRKMKKNDPFVDLSVPSNVTVWCALRKVLTDYGVTFQRRINVYATLFSVYVITLVIMIAVAVYAPGERLVIQADLTLILFVIIDVAMFMAVTFVIVLIGGRLNFTAQRHSHHCALKRCEVYEYITLKEHELDSNSIQRLNMSANLLATTVETVRSANAVTVSKTLGFESSGQIAGVFAAFASTGIGIAAKAISTLAS